MTGTIRRLAAASMTLLATAFAAPAHAEYPDRHIDMIITYGAGGGFDIYARAVGRMMEKSLPKGLKVIPRNIPGAGGKRGTASLFRAPADGYTMGILNLPGVVEPQILDEKVHYDLDKMTWVGGINIGVYSLVVGGKSRFATYEAVAASPKEVFFATVGGSDFTLARIMASVLKLNAKFVTGYKGAPAAHLAIVRGEADAGLAINTTIQTKVEAGDLKALMTLQTNATKPQFAGAKTASDIGHPELANLRLFRLFAAPPALPSAVRSKLTAMVEKAVNDPELAEWAQKTRHPIDPMTGADAARFYAEQKAFLTKYKHLLK